MMSTDQSPDQNRASGFFSASLIEMETVDLTLHSVLSYFVKSTRNVQLINFLLALDRVDKWAVDYDEMESTESIQIQIFIQELQEFIKTALPVLHLVPREFADILSHLTTTRCMYLLRFVGQHNPEFLDHFSSIFQQDSKSINMIAIKRRLETFSNAELLGEIFSSTRLKKILEIMGNSDA